MDSIFQHALKLAQQAQALEAEILHALADGNIEKAEACCMHRQNIIESIPFAEFTESPPTALLEMLQQLLSSNNHMTTVTETVQLEIDQQLRAVKKGKAGSQAYRSINEHK